MKTKALAAYAALLTLTFLMHLAYNAGKQSGKAETLSRVSAIATPKVTIDTILKQFPEIDP